MEYPEHIQVIDKLNPDTVYIISLSIIMPTKEIRIRNGWMKFREIFPFLTFTVGDERSSVCQLC